MVSPCFREGRCPIIGRMVADRDRWHHDGCRSWGQPRPNGSATLPFFGVQPALVDNDGNILGAADGNLILDSSPCRAAVAGGYDALKNLFLFICQLLCTGDGARRDEDGYYWITGRVDDVWNVQVIGWVPLKLSQRWLPVRSLKQRQWVIRMILKSEVSMFM